MNVYAARGTAWHVRRLLGVLAVFVGAAMVASETHAAFKGAEDPPVTVASIQLTSDDEGRALFRALHMTPGQQVSNCIAIDATAADGPTPLGLHGTASGPLAGQLGLTVAAGTGGGYGNCSGFAGVPVFTGSLGSFTSQHGDAKDALQVQPPQGSSGKTTFRFTIVAAAGVAQAQQASATFRWTAEAPLAPPTEPAPEPVEEPKPDPQPEPTPEPVEEPQPAPTLEASPDAAPAPGLPPAPETDTATEPSTGTGDGAAPSRTPVEDSGATQDPVLSSEPSSDAPEGGTTSTPPGTAPSEAEPEEAASALLPSEPQGGAEADDEPRLAGTVAESGADSSDEPGSGTFVQYLSDFFERLKDIAQVAVQVAEEVAERSAFPGGLAMMMIGFFAVQDRIDRRDPKLALAPVQAEPDLEFKPPPTKKANPPTGSTGSTS
jgi:hypothetical protein